MSLLINNLEEMLGTKETFEHTSTCCHSTPIEDFKESNDHHDPTPIYICSKCNKECELND